MHQQRSDAHLYVDESWREVFRIAGTGETERLAGKGLSYHVGSVGEGGKKLMGVTGEGRVADRRADAKGVVALVATVGINVLREDSGFNCEKLGFVVLYPLK